MVLGDILNFTSNTSFVTAMYYKAIVVVVVVGFLALAFQATMPPPPNIFGSPGGPPITATRIKLRDGRHLAYEQHGVPKEIAKYKLVFFRGFSSGRHDPFVLVPEIAEELGLHLVSFDRPGYGESDPHPKRTLKSTAFDVEELADQLELGSKFYVIGNSMGGQLVWACLKYIPHRDPAMAAEKTPRGVEVEICDCDNQWVHPRAIGKEALLRPENERIEYLECSSGTVETLAGLDILEYCCCGREYYCYVGRLSFKYCCNGCVYKAF
ncbi:hypothetical protein Vadar_015555 [Vaccinium darrowii]|uniref:Uncharacterized protein n=1 Tax=Vaccinium darrowii TaxID=229202 RepID=A0ACB7YP13_9ERIC|nr:hypothetical protein Vadar_015555 [Vaccinium darrowii]